MARPSGSETEDSLGVSADSDCQEHHSGALKASPIAGVADVSSDLLEYAKTLGVDLCQDTDMYWVVLEAFEAPLPAGWTEHADDCSRTYFFNQVTEESTWAHPMDGVYRELIGVVQRIKMDERASQARCGPSPDCDRRSRTMREHLLEVHSRALGKLSGWSGPYDSETGPYYYNELCGTSTWVSPIAVWEDELAVRHSVLHRCLLADLPKSEKHFLQNDADMSEAPLTTLQLPLGLAREEDAQHSSRSFYTARESARSGRSTLSGGECISPPAHGHGTRGNSGGAAARGDLGAAPLVSA